MRRYIYVRLQYLLEIIILLLVQCGGLYIREMRVWEGGISRGAMGGTGNGRIGEGGGGQGGNGGGGG